MQNNLNKFQIKFLKLLMKEHMDLALTFIDFLEFQIKVRRKYLNILKRKKVFCFSSERKKEINKKVKIAEEEIKNYYSKINEELKDIYLLDELEKSL